MKSAQSPVITRVDAMGVAIPLKKPMRMAGVRITHAENLIVRIEADNGMVGWGESASAPTMTGDLVPGMLCAVEQFFKPLLIGKEIFERNTLMQQVHRAVLRNSGAKCAVDSALLDLCGKTMEMPVYELLGGARRRELRPMHLLGNDSIDEDVKEARAKMADGISFFKIKVGVKPTEQEVESTRLLRQALGPEAILCADGNMGLSADQVIAYCDQVAEQNLLFLEQPLRSDNLQGMADLASRLSIPICADESVGSTADMMQLKTSGAASGVNLKIIKFGGLAAVVHASHLCEEIGFAINLACKVGESSIAAAGISQIGYVMSNLDWGISMTNHYLADDLVLEPVAPVNGVIRIDRKPGLGITVDEQKVQKYRTH